MYNNITLSFLGYSKNLEENHLHNEYEIIYVKKGQSLFGVNGRKIYLQAGDMIILSNLEKHSFAVRSSNYERYMIKVKDIYELKNLPPNILTKVFQKRPIDFPYKFTFNDITKPHVEYIFDRMINESYLNYYFEEYLSILISELMIFVYRSNLEYFNKKEEVLEATIIDIQSYLNINYYEDITLDSIERKFYISKYAISRQFKEVTGYNFKNYLILIRLSAAKNYLINTDLPIKTIADNVGYNSENVFIRTFKKYENMTPTTFRRKYCITTTP